MPIVNKQIITDLLLKLAVFVSKDSKRKNTHIMHCDEASSNCRCRNIVNGQYK